MAARPGVFEVFRSRVVGYFRKRRLARFQEMFPEETCHSVLDMGGTSAIWKMLGYKADVTLLNLEHLEDVKGFKTEIGDARQTSFPDDSFDLVFSNSVIEHVGNLEDQKRMAHEMRRLGKRVYCQTPNRWFPIEPHFMAPLIHWLPRSCQTLSLLRYCSLYGLLRRPRPTDATLIGLRDGTRFLSRREMESLFPDCQIHTERVLGWPKSYVAFRL